MVSSRQAGRNQNGSALQTRSLVVDFQGGFGALDFWERPRSSQRQPCGNSSGPVKAGAFPRRNFLTGIECLTWRERMRCGAQSFELF